MKFFAELDFATAFMLKAQIYLHLLTKDAKNVAPANCVPQVVQVMYLPPLVETPCLEVARAIDDVLKTARIDGDVMQMCTVAGSLLSELKSFIKAAGNSKDMPGCLATFCDILIGQHKY